ncbi:MAG: hypothetical protein KDA96_20900, partial [Planctomycetaceae bacterium]|nr:hypothetical protein [Planctomycetaceae bacterium]
GGSLKIVGSVSEKALTSQQNLIAAFFTPEPWVNGVVFELLDENGFVVATQSSHNLDLSGDGFITQETEAGWFVFDGLLPGSYSVRRSTADGMVTTVGFAAGQTTINATLAGYGFRTPVRDYFNFGGRNERWLQDSNGTWYFVTPDGALYRWDRISGGTHGTARGTWVADVPSSWYLNPHLFHEAGTTTVSVTGGQRVSGLLFGQHSVLDGLFSDLKDDLLN